MPVRCALGCVERGVHRFPNPEKFPEQFKAWVQIMGGKLQTPEDYIQYRGKRICDIHFTEKDMNRNHRLSALAVPSQHLPSWCSLPQPMDSSAATTMSSTSSFTTLLDTVNVSTSYTSNEVSTTYASKEASTSYASNEVSTTYASKEASTSYASNEASATYASKEASTSYASNEALTAFVSDGAAIKATPYVPAARSCIDIEHNYCVKPRPIKICQQSGIPTFEVSKMKTTVRQIKNLKREILRLRKRGLSFKSRLQNASRISDDLAFRQVTKHMTEPAKLFTYMNFRESGKKPKGRRFSIEEKILSLSIFKKSPKCYSLLSKYFTLPSKKSLKILLSAVELNPGINKLIFEKIKNAVRSMNIEDKLCTLIFDEMSITPQVHYNVAKDRLKGFTTGCSNKICDHALVFMVKGLKANYKQPVAYYFTNKLHKDELKSIIIEVVKNVHATGLQIMCTVCDQSTVNVSAINSLIDDTKANCLRKGLEWRYEHFKISQKIIIPIYDCPHLLKGLRNNLLTKDLIYMDNENKKIVKWAYWEMLYAADKTYGELRCAPKLTEEHVNSEKIKKMKVKLAAQVFSHSVAVATEHLSARGDLPQECRDLIPFVLLIDKLFDSVNGSTFDIRNGKIYKAAVKRNSPHHELWQKSVKVLKTTKFITKKVSSGKVRFIETTVPSIRNLIKTIEAMQIIWKKLHTKYSFDSLLTRNLNQDPLENFFGNIRSYGGRDVAPNCISFEGAFKALLLNNFSSPHSIQANCEEDNNNTLQNLKFFLTEKPNNPKEIFHEAVINMNNEIINAFEDTHDEDKGQRNYVCGWVVTKCLKNVSKRCKECRKDLIDCNGDNSASCSLIRAKEYNNKKKSLCYPSKSAESIFQIIQKTTCAYIKRDIPKSGLKYQIKMICDTIITNYPFKCKKHNLKEYFVDVSINILIFSWCRSINRILAGKITYDGDDEIKLAAQIYYNKHKSYKQK